MKLKKIRIMETQLFGKNLVLGLMASVLFLLAAPALAQEEHSPKVLEKQVVEDPATHVDPASLGTPKSTTAKPGFLLTPTKKEATAPHHLQEKESKKNESPSTLSFNIFLYIVDKFKQDFH